MKEGSMLESAEVVHRGEGTGGQSVESLPQGPLFELRPNGQRNQPLQVCERQRHLMAE